MESAEERDEQKSSKKKSYRFIKSKRRQQHVEKTIGDSVESKAGSADRISDTAPLKEYRLQSLQARVVKLQEENSRLSQEMKRRSKNCCNLMDCNTSLMDYLKVLCEPALIQYLERINPVNNPQVAE